MVERNVFQSAARQGAMYLVHNQQDDGNIGGELILNYYKAPWALTALGYSHEAVKLLEWIKHNTQTEPGQFHKGDDFPGALRSSTYRNAFILLGALLAGQFDIVSLAAIQNLLGYQHKSLGAFYGEYIYDDDVLLNTNHSGMVALFCLYAGRYSNAEFAGEYILEHFAKQPDVSQVFYIHSNTNGELITDFPDEESFWHVIDYGKTEGHYWAIGTAAAFLTQLFAFTGKTKYLATAEELINLVTYVESGYEKWPSSGKIAWAAANLYSVTKNDAYLDLARTIGHECFLKTQKDDGSWGPFFFRMGGQGQGYELSVYELTSEFTMLCSELAKLLSVTKTF